MKKEYDFTGGVRGKFYKPGAQLHFPIYLESKLQDRLEVIAEKKGKDLGELVNMIVRKELDLLEELR